MAEHVAAHENGTEVDELTYRQRKRVYTSLHQAHLPTLDDADIVEYDRDRGTVSLTDHAAAFGIYLTPESERPWHRYYLALAVLALLVVASAWAGLTPFTAVPALAYAGGFAVSLGALASVHAFHAAARADNRQGTWTDVVLLEEE